ncbi:MAG: GntR family transcriptional regulator [Bacteroidota bacterium]|nr:GntR family transcriptional regulator [Bacteroidota bacterium]MDP4211026.1 GntR family transcriptional regulator [Bacteroidota bacterium]MDP4248752.1 GntR family transcriptional regulator [Bacteroidota bacterium]
MKTDSLTSKAYHEIRKKILSNQFPAHTRLKEDFWAKKLMVSRIAIRESLTRLLGEGLLTTGEKGGFFVLGLNAGDVHQIRELREILEIGALKLAIRKVTRQQIDQLEKICDEFRTMADRGYFNGACEADIKFHETLIKCADNEKLFAVYVSSHIPIFHQKLGNIQIYLDDYNQSDREHRQIVKGLKEKNLSLAQKYLIRQFSRGETAILDLEPGEKMS